MSNIDTYPKEYDYKIYRLTNDELIEVGVTVKNTIG